MYTVKLHGQDEHISFYAYKSYIARQEGRKAAREAKTVAKAEAKAAAVAHVAALKAAAAEQAATAAARKAAHKGGRSRGPRKASTTGTVAAAGSTHDAGAHAAAAATFQATPIGCLAGRQHQGGLGRKHMTAHTATTATAWHSAVVGTAPSTDVTAAAQNAAAAAAHHTDRKALLAAHKAAITAITGTPPPAAGAAATAALRAATNRRLNAAAGTGAPLAKLIWGLACCSSASWQHVTVSTSVSAQLPHAQHCAKP
jgi:hypothetical protein